MKLTSERWLSRVRGLFRGRTAPRDRKQGINDVTPGPSHTMERETVYTVVASERESQTLCGSEVGSTKPKGESVFSGDISGKKPELETHRQNVYSFTPTLASGLQKEGDRKVQKSASFPTPCTGHGKKYSSRTTPPPPPPRTSSKIPKFHSNEGKCSPPSKKLTTGDVLTKDVDGRHSYSLSTKSPGYVPTGDVGEQHSCPHVSRIPKYLIQIEEGKALAWGEPADTGKGNAAHGECTACSDLRSPRRSSKQEEARQVAENTGDFPVKEKEETNVMVSKIPISSTHYVKECEISMDTHERDCAVSSAPATSRYVMTDKEESLKHSSRSSSRSSKLPKKDRAITTNVSSKVPVVVVHKPETGREESSDQSSVEPEQLSDRPSIKPAETSHHSSTEPVVSSNDSPVDPEKSSTDVHGTSTEHRKEHTRSLEHSSIDTAMHTRSTFDAPSTSTKEHKKIAYASSPKHSTNETSSTSTKEHRKDHVPSSEHSSIETTKSCKHATNDIRNTSTKEHGKDRARSSKHKKESSGSSRRHAAKDEDVRRLAHNMAGSIENLIGNLHGIVGDLHELVKQIDVVTDSIDHSCSGHKAAVGTAHSVDRCSGPSAPVRITGDEGSSLGEMHQNDFQEAAVAPEANCAFVDTEVNKGVGVSSLRHRSSHRNSSRSDHTQEKRIPLENCESFVRVPARLEGSPTKAASSHRFSYPQCSSRSFSIPPSASESDVYGVHGQKSHRRSRSSKRDTYIRYPAQQNETNAADNDTDLQQDGGDEQYVSDINQTYSNSLTIPKQQCIHGATEPQVYKASPSVSSYSLSSAFTSIPDDNLAFELIASPAREGDNLSENVDQSKDLLSACGPINEDKKSDQGKDSDSLPDTGLKNWRAKTETRQCGSAESLTPQMDWSYLALTDHDPCLTMGDEFNPPASDHKPDSFTVHKQALWPFAFLHTKVPSLDPHQTHWLAPPGIKTNWYVAHHQQANLPKSSSNWSKPDLESRNKPDYLRVENPNPKQPKKDPSKLALTGLKIKHEMSSTPEKAAGRKIPTYKHTGKTREVALPYSDVHRRHVLPQGRRSNCAFFLVQQQGTVGEDAHFRWQNSGVYSYLQSHSVRGVSSPETNFADAGISHQARPQKVGNVFSERNSASSKAFRQAEQAAGDACRKPSSGPAKSAIPKADEENVGQICGLKAKRTADLSDVTERGKQAEIGKSAEVPQETEHQHEDVWVQRSSTRADIACETDHKQKRASSMQRSSSTGIPSRTERQAASTDSKQKNPSYIGASSRTDKQVLSGITAHRVPSNARVLLRSESVPFSGVASQRTINTTSASRLAEHHHFSGLSLQRNPTFVEHRTTASSRKPESPPFSGVGPQRSSNSATTSHPSEHQHFRGISSQINPIFTEHLAVSGVKASAQRNLNSAGTNIPRYVHSKQRSSSESTTGGVLKAQGTNPSSSTSTTDEDLRVEQNECEESQGWIASRVHASKPIHSVIPSISHSVPSKPRSVSESSTSVPSAEITKHSSTTGVFPHVEQSVGGASLGWNTSTKALPDWPSGDLSSIEASDTDVDDLSSPFLPQHFQFPRRSSAVDTSPEPQSGSLSADSNRRSRTSPVPDFLSPPQRSYQPPRRSSAMDTSPERSGDIKSSDSEKMNSAASSGSDALSPTQNTYPLSTQNFQLQSKNVGVSNDKQNQNDKTEVGVSEASSSSSYSLSPGEALLPPEQFRFPNRRSYDDSDTDQKQDLNHSVSESTSSDQEPNQQINGNRTTVPFVFDTMASGGFEISGDVELTPESDVTSSYKGQYENAMENRLEQLTSEAEGSDFSDADADAGSDVLEQSLTSLELSGSAKYDRDVNTWKSYTMTHIDSDDVVSECASDILNENFIEAGTANPGFDDVNLNFDDVNFPSIAY